MLFGLTFIVGSLLYFLFG